MPYLLKQKVIRIKNPISWFRNRVIDIIVFYNYLKLANAIPIIENKNITPYIDNIIIASIPINL